jgi:hypothetical protein
MEPFGPSPYRRAMEKVRALEIECEQLKFLNQEERATIDVLSRLCLRAADVLERGSGIEDFDCTSRLKLIIELREAAQ